MNDLILVVILLVLTAYFSLFRNSMVCDVRNAFVDDDTLFPDAYRALPTYDDMVFSPRHQFRWTKAQWVKWVAAQGVTA